MSNSLSSDQPSLSPAVLAELRHDLRTPIGHIIGYAEILLEEDAETGRGQTADLMRIRDAGWGLLRLLDERLSESERTESHSKAALEISALDNEINLPAVGTGPLNEAGIVLVVDNDADNRDVLARRLGRLGHHAVLASTGEEALGLLDQQVFDVVLLDVMMPGLSGYDVLRQIKSNPLIAYIPVIMISALDDMASVVRCIDLGAADYLAKPFEPTLLKARVNASLRAKRAHDREMHLAADLQDHYDKLKAAEQMRDDLTGMIVHDLRTPLTSILSGLQTLELLGDLDVDQREMLMISTDGAQTLLGMINDLLDISKLEDGSLKLERTQISASELIDRAKRQVALLAREKSLDLEESVATDTPLFLGDEDKLRRTLVNLVGNALKFTPAGGKITIGATTTDTEIVFFVRDTGEGIPAEAFGKIFEKFGQVESRKAGRKMSTGLGLTFCKMAVEAHGGRIWVESELGVGSTFLFAVPR